MSETPFREPKIVLNRIYTRGGDEGETSLVNGRRVRKDDPRIETYGTVDELNACVGLALCSIRDALPQVPELLRLSGILLRIQHELFNLGSILATDPEHVHPRQPQVRQAEVDQLERDIDALNQAVPALRSFVLPGGSRLNAELHLCRTVCRRAERLCIHLAGSETVPGEVLAYLNRLSDAFFVFSRWASQVLGVEEVLWQPNQAASGSSGCAGANPSQGS
jgi:cob(I)alamin adenosyltransferase